MQQKALSIRPFIGSKNFETSRNFYADLGCNEVKLSSQLSLFTLNSVCFYLQDAYVKDWIDNTMLFLEVENVDEYWKYLLSLQLTTKYAGVKLIKPTVLNWGKECFLHDPSGILWHIGQFN